MLFLVCFLGCLGFVVGFLCVWGKVAEVLKMLVFPSFWALLLFVLALFLFCCWIAVGVLVVFWFFIFFHVFVFPV